MFPKDAVLATIDPTSGSIVASRQSRIRLGHGELPRAGQRPKLRMDHRLRRKGRHRPEPESRRHRSRQPTGSHLGRGDVLIALGPPPTETTWNDRPIAYGAGGGGMSVDVCHAGLPGGTCSGVRVAVRVRAPAEYAARSPTSRPTRTRPRATSCSEYGQSGWTPWAARAPRHRCGRPSWPSCRRPTGPRAGTALSTMRSMRSRPGRRRISTT